MTIEVLLTIAKIAGITLGSVLAFAILIILLVLFVPIRYRFHVSKEGSFVAFGKATWLFHILSIRYHFVSREEGLKRTIRVCGLHILKDHKSEPKDSGRVIRWEDDTGSYPGAASARSASEVPKAAIEEPNDDRSSAVQHASTVTEQNENVQKRKKDCNFSDIKKRVLDGIANIKKIRDFLKDETFLRALSLCKGQLYRAWKSFRPRKVNGYVHFGFDDPALTGQILGATSLCYAFYGESLRVIPDFESQVFEGKLDLKGRIRVITVILIGAKLYFDKDLRRLWAMISKEEK
ncbi:MAG: DUF2953 domain-containing protein [Lachnospiraceae bacterium]|nr:DUF2953 domain-containing protein [Lachnospiraceae bacterium]